jgi:hypothetical protein
VSGQPYSPYPAVNAWVEAIRDHPDLGDEEYALARVYARVMDANGHAEKLDEAVEDAAFQLELEQVKRERS